MGRRAFDLFNTEANRRAFTKVFLYLCEGKIAYAQRNAPPVQLTLYHAKKFDESTLTDFDYYSRRLPFPMAMLVESIGIVKLPDETAVPFLQQEEDAGLITFEPSMLQVNLLQYAEFQPSEYVRNAREYLRYLEKDDDLWEIQPAVPAEVNADGIVLADARPERARIRPQLLLEYNLGEPPTSDELTLFNGIINCLCPVRDFVISSSLKNGLGSPSQIVQFHDHERDRENRVYSILKLPFEEYVSTVAFRFGDVPDRLKARSRYTSGEYDTALQVASLSALTCRNAVMPYPR